MTEQTRTVVVTGAGSGMGESVAQRFVSEGWRVVAVDLNTESLESLAAQHGSAIIPAPVDVRDRAAVDAAVAGAVGEGHLAAVVNAAGIYPTSTLDDYTEDLYRRIFDINVLGTINVTAAAAPFMRAHGEGGAVVNFASIDAFAVSRGQLLYCASKAAVVSLTRSLAIELAPDSISVNAIAPGWVATPGTIAGGRIEEAVKAVPLGRAARPEEIADWVWNLARNPGGYLTGETVVVSGGLVMR